jgi:hypothetical protein
MTNESKALLSMIIAVICFMTAGFSFFEVYLIKQKRYDESVLYNPIKKSAEKLGFVSK